MILLRMLFFAAMLGAQTNSSSPVPVKDDNVAAILSGLFPCNASAFATITTAGNTQLVPLTAGKTIHVCGMLIESKGTGTVRLQAATAANCGGTLTAITPTFNLGSVIPFGNGLGILFTAGQSKSICATSASAIISINVMLVYRVI